MNEEREVSVGVIGHDQQLMVQFADGQYVVPEFALEVLGGMQHLLTISSNLKEKTFGEFLDAIHVINVKQVLNSIHRDIILDHVNPKPLL